MAGNVRFAVSVVVKNADVLPELAGRLKDLSPAFTAFVPEWAKLNEDIFDASKGMEASGVSVDALVEWDPLVPASSKSKRLRGRPDWLMVDSGDLRRALTNPDLIFQRITEIDATFGTPLNLEEANKIRWNWEKRQAIFLSTQDQNALRRILQDYFSMGAGFEEKRFAKGLAAVQLRQEMGDMDASFKNDCQREEF